MNNPAGTERCDTPGTVSTEATTGGTDIRFGVATGVGCAADETMICPDVGATLASNGTYGIALGGGRTPNPPTIPDPDTDTPLELIAPPDVTVILDPGVPPTLGSAALLGGGMSPDPGTPLDFSPPLDPPMPVSPDAPPVAHNKPQCHHSNVIMTPLYFCPGQCWPDSYTMSIRA